MTTYNLSIQPNLGVVGTAGYCLIYCRLITGAPAGFPTALSSWQGARSRGTAHTDTNYPTGSVLYFNWTDPADGINYGHVVYAAPGGLLYSTPASGTGHITFNSIAQVTSWLARGNGSYLGWAEDLNGLRLIAPVTINNQGTTEPMIDQATLNNVYQGLLNRSPDQSAIDHYVGHYTTSFVVQDVMDSAEYQSVRAGASNLQSQLSAANSTITQLHAQGANDAQTITDLTNQKNDLVSQLNDANAKLATAGAPAEVIADVTPGQPTDNTQTTKPTRASLIVKLLAGLLSLRKKTK